MHWCSEIRYHIWPEGTEVIPSVGIPITLLYTNDTVAAPCPYVFPDHLIVDNLIALRRKCNELIPFICGNLNRDIGTPLCGRCTTNVTGPSIYFAGSHAVCELQCSKCNVLPPLAVSSHYSPRCDYYCVQYQHHLSTNGTLFAVLWLCCTILRINCWCIC